MAVGPTGAHEARNVPPSNASTVMIASGTVVTAKPTFAATKNMPQSSPIDCLARNTIQAPRRLLAIAEQDFSRLIRKIRHHGTNVRPPRSLRCIGNRQPRTVDPMVTVVDQQQLAGQLLAQAREQRVDLIGPNGLLNQLTIWRERSARVPPRRAHVATPTVRAAAARIVAFGNLTSCLPVR